MIASGQVIKTFRQVRGATPKQVYDGIMSRTNYARFERGAIDTATENLYLMLRRLNVSLREWYYTLQQADEAQAALLRQLDVLVAQGTQEEAPEPFRQAAKLTSDANARWQLPGMQHRRWLYLAYAAFYAQQQDVNQPNAWLAKLVALLTEAESWSTGDIEMLYNLLEIAPPATALQLIRRYLALIQQSPELLRYGFIAPGDVLNEGMVAAVRQRDWAIFQALLDEFNRLQMTECHPAPLVFRRVCNLFAAAHTGDEAALTQLPAVLTLLTTLDLPRLRDAVTEQIEALRAWLTPGVTLGGTS